MILLYCDTPLKIQYLRLIYTFCYRDNINFINKFKLISDKDILRFLKSGYMDLIKVSLKEKYDFYKNNNNVTFNNLFNSIYMKLEVEYYNKNDNEICLL